MRPCEMCQADKEFCRLCSNDKRRAMVIGRPDCSWCTRAVELLGLHGVEVDYYDYTVHPEKKEVLLRAQLQTVPQVWIDGHYVGGYQALAQHLKEK